MPKILVTEPEFFPKEFMDSLQKFGDVIAKRMNKNELLKEIEDTDLLLIRVDTKVDKELIDNAKQLHAIFSVTTGLDNIDTKYAESKGVKVISPPGYATNAVAEHTFALMLSLSRKIHSGFNSLKDGNWDRHKFIGNELTGKTLGIIGLGRIGKQIAKYSSAFGMKVISYDPYVTKEAAAEFGAELTSLEAVIENSDFITINVALSAETTKMINEDTINKMKRSAIIVNTSRGAVVDENALIKALENGRLGGAALDVFENEPLSPTSSLITYAKSHDNLLITPHISGSTHESLQDACSIILEKIKEHLQKSGSQGGK